MEVIFHKYYQRLCHFAWQIVQDDDLVQDLVQEAFIAFWKNRSKLADDELVHKSFLYSTVKNLCLNRLRHEKIVHKYRIHQQEKPIEVNNQEMVIIRKLIRSEIMEDVIRIIRTMPMGCQEVFRLSYLEGLSNDEVAQELSISVNTVKTHKKRGLRLIRAKINPEFYSFLFL